MDSKSAFFVAAFALFVAILCGSITPSAAQSSFTNVHALDSKSVCNGIQWLVLSTGGCGKPGTDITVVSESRFTAHADWLGQGVCAPGKRKVKKCCYREKGDQTIYQFSGDYTYKCTTQPRKWDVTDKAEFQVATSSRRF